MRTGLAYGFPMGVALLALLAWAETDPLANQYSTDVLRPPDYATFKPPSAGRSFRDPVFGTEIEVITDRHNIVEWNGERAHFSQDDKYFAVGVKPDRDKKSETWLYDGRTGAFIKSLPIAQFDNVRWGYDPKTLLYFTTNQVRGYNVETDADTLLREFDEPVGLCGGDGNDFDDKGEWILLNHGKKVGRMFAFNSRTGQTGRKWSCPDPQAEADIDYATISPSGQYVVVLRANASASPDRPLSGTGLYDRNGKFIRQLVPFGAHVDFGYVNGTDECLIMKGWGPFYAGWCAPRALHKRDVWALSFASGKVTKLMEQAANNYQTAAVGGSNRRYVYMAFKCEGQNPDGQWEKHLGEIVEVPLDGSQRVRRLLHHRCRPYKGPGVWGEQPDLWINHAGDRLFFRSNMFMAQGATGQKYGQDLFMVKIPSRAPAP